MNQNLLSRLSAVNPLVSVIIPSFNHEKYVGKAIESVINEGYGQIELIVIDDGSVDGSYEIIRKLGEHYNFFYERHENIGLVKTLNKGLTHCHGEYIRVLASDDIYFPGILQEMINVASCKDILAVFSNGKEISSDGQSTESLYVGNLETLLSGDSEQLQQYFLTNMSKVFLQSGVFHRDLVDAIGGFDHGVRSDDWVFFIQAFNYIVASQKKHAFINLDGLGYRRHDSNISRNPDAKLMEMIEEVIENFIPERNRNALYAWLYWGVGLDEIKRKSIRNIFKGIILLEKSMMYEFSLKRINESFVKGVKKII